jgi:hypothetical protein
MNDEPIGRVHLPGEAALFWALMILLTVFTHWLAFRFGQWWALTGAVCVL